MLRTVFFWTVVAFVSSTLSAQAKGVDYNARIGAKYSIGGKGEAVGIERFDGDDGDEFASVLRGVLQSAELDGKQLLNISNSSPDVVIGGKILEARLTRTPYEKKKKKCVQPGDKFWQCDQWEETYVSCEQIAASYSVTAIGMRLQGRQSIFSQGIQQQGEYHACEGGGGKPLQYTGTALVAEVEGTVSTPEDLLNQLRLRTAMSLRELVTPYNKVITVQFMSGTQGLVKDSLKNYRSGMDFVAAGRLDRGCSILESVGAIEGNEASVVINFNLGVCNEAMLPDNPAVAFDFYNKADQLLTKPNKQVSEALARMKELVTQSQRIN